MASRRRELIGDIFPNAKPGNAAWKRIERLQGEDGDYSPWDAGTEPNKPL